ncbi:hypothetical protein Taro_047496 [Colocasia esculenta]|uniref:Bifunctional inhibitor/plant lipid transfer protein/seed storage helical domain-containing protein n=1 Tax=Colocasia esculenta TaxID=4460 RepID=A0A843WWA5_COLES|nr:hypothetical protein [Colocasia esculenta]
MGMPKTLLSPMAIVLAALLMAAGMAPPASAEIATPCTASVITSFTPCLFYLTGGGVGAWSESPTADCCAVVGELLRSSAECTCLILNGNVPFSLPFNRTLAITLPGACQSEEVPLQCKGDVEKNPSPSSSSVKAYPFLFLLQDPSALAQASVSRTRLTHYNTSSIRFSPFRNWPTLLPPPAKRRPIPVPPAADTALAPSGLAREKPMLRPLEYLASAVEPLSFYWGTLLTSMAINGALFLSKL